ncbi:histidine--tRNA ligase [Candidatus Micrarchaeota archaeon]|nr:histidine--tRNA ligase [Candidatus Micrarchaeota archaeon]MBI5177522.1 histidine--tRNA ligase [Candidatus Micrarchaeota archaeon]
MTNATNLDEQKLQAPRGTRDFALRKKILRDWVVDTLRKSFATYGFDALETPAFENAEVLSAKFAGGAEILKETYWLQDQAGRKLGLRYDLTVPLCRFVAENPNLAKPFKRCAIASVWRDGPLKLGRYREFMQADADTVGASGSLAEAEILLLALSAFEALGLDCVIKVNSRRVIDGMMEAAGVPGGKRVEAIIALDKLAKVGGGKVAAEMVAKGIPPKACDSLLKMAGMKSLDSLLALVKSEDGTKGIGELKELLSIVSGAGLRNPEKIVFDPSLARGLNYYTGVVYEAFLANGASVGIISSVAGGGRYDGLIGRFVEAAGGGGEPVPAVGISFGIDVICDALSADADRIAPANSLAKVFVIPIKAEREGFAIAQQLRAAGVACSMDLLSRSISKNLDYASKMGVPFVIIIGKQELDAGKVKLRDMESGREEMLPLNSAIAKLK